MHLLPKYYDCCPIPWYLYLHTIVCTDEHGIFQEIAHEDEQGFWNVTIFFQCRGSFLWFSHDVKQRGQDTRRTDSDDAD